LAKLGGQQHGVERRDHGGGIVGQHKHSVNAIIGKNLRRDPGQAVAITGSPQASASSRALGKPSKRQGQDKKALLAPLELRAIFDETRQQDSVLASTFGPQPLHDSCSLPVVNAWIQGREGLPTGRLEVEE
jgi:hypothetical protein